METAIKQHPPFTCGYTSQLPELLANLNCSIALTTYQAGKLVFISPDPDKERMHTLPRNFEKPMGIAVQGNKMAIATKDSVHVFSNSKEIAPYYPKKPDTYDSMWLPRRTFYTGRVDLHDIAFGNDGLYAINTSFSCLCRIDDNYSFTPVWKPPFIDSLKSEDRCHLNGLVMQDGMPKYVTGLGQTNIMQGWRENITNGGFLMDVTTNEVILEGLAMPHSPRMYKGELYMLLSATGEFIKVNIQERSYEVIKKFDGFCRGLDIVDDYAFIGFSKLRKNSSTFAKLSFSDHANFAGVKVIHVPTGAEVGSITYATSVDEIYEVSVLQNTIRPNILNPQDPSQHDSLVIPNATFWAKPME